MTAQQAALDAYRAWRLRQQHRRLVFLETLVRDAKVSDWGVGWRDERLPPERC